MTRDDGYAAMAVLAATGATRQQLQTHEREEGDAVVTYYTVSVWLTDATAGNVITRTLNALPTSEMAVALLSEMRQERDSRGRQVTARRRVEREMDRS